MTPAALRPSRIAIAVALAAFGFVASMVVPFVWRLVRPLAAGDALPAGFTPSSALAVAVLGVGVVVLFGAALYRRLATRIDEEGLLVPGLAGARRVRWADIERVSGRGMQVRLHTARSAVTINPLCYAGPREAMTFLLQRLPRPALPKGVLPGG